VDYRKSLDNYHSHIFDYLRNKGFDTDVFLCTVTSKLDKQLLLDYKPVRHAFVQHSDLSVKSGDHFSKMEKQRQAINLALKYSQEASVNYSTVILTRFDLLFQEDFADSNIKWDMLNLVSTLQEKRYIDDNFYAMPFDKLRAFDGVLAQALRTRTWSHGLLPSFRGVAEVNFIKDEGQRAEELSWFRIVRKKARIVRAKRR